ncbi:hypothetical protein ACFQ9T_30130, partial [Bacillus cereus]
RIAPEPGRTGRMKTYEKKEVVRTEERVKSIICDTCRKVIDTEDPKSHRYEVTVSHSRWRNDSHESVKELDFCCYECLQENMNEFFKNGYHTDNYDIERIG